ncbi:MAG: SpaA isopeptide-forming pilin-related protein [Tissierellales bacterium]
MMKKRVLGIVALMLLILIMTTACDKTVGNQVEETPIDDEKELEIVDESDLEENIDDNKDIDKIEVIYDLKKDFDKIKQLIITLPKDGDFGIIKYRDQYEDLSGLFRFDNELKVERIDLPENLWSKYEYREEYDFQFANYGRAIVADKGKDYVPDYKFGIMDVNGDWIMEPKYNFIDVELLRQGIGYAYIGASGGENQIEILTTNADGTVKVINKTLDNYMYYEVKTLDGYVVAGSEVFSNDVDIRDGVNIDSLDYIKLNKLKKINGFWLTYSGRLREYLVLDQYLDIIDASKDNRPKDIYLEYSVNEYGQLITIAPMRYTGLGLYGERKQSDGARIKIDGKTYINLHSINDEIVYVNDHMFLEEKVEIEDSNGRLVVIDRENNKIISESDSIYCGNVGIYKNARYDIVDRSLEPEKGTKGMVYRTVFKEIVDAENDEDIKTEQIIFDHEGIKLFTQDEFADRLYSQLGTTYAELSDINIGTYIYEAQDENE